MKPSLLSLTATLALACASALAAPSKVYFDLIHTTMTAPPAPLVDHAKKSGVELASGQAPITAAALEGTRLAYLRAPTKPFAAGEKEALIAFVRGGGSLLVILDEESRTPLATTGINDIISPFGLKLTADTEYLHNQGAIAKAGPINKADRELPFSGGRAVEGGTPFAWQLDREGKPREPFAAYRQLEKGARIVVMSDAMASAYLGKPEGVRLTGVPRNAAQTTYWGKDSAIFMEEVLAWLLQK